MVDCHTQGLGFKDYLRKALGFGFKHQGSGGGFRMRGARALV